MAETLELRGLKVMNGAKSNQSTHTTSRWWHGCWAGIPVFIILGVIIFQGISILRNGGIRLSPEEPGSPMDMRGCIIAILRLNGAHPPQKIAFCDNNTVARVANPPNRAEIHYVPLTEEEQQTMLALRNTWCANPPRFEAAELQNRPDDFGLRCTKSSLVTPFRIPHNKLPPILQQLDSRLPPLRLR
jgi:hypothetical protein